MMLGILYEVSDPKTGRKVWLAALDKETDNLWVFDPRTDKFHHNLGLSHDFVWERDLHYEAVDRETAIELRQAKVGEKIPSDLGRRHHEDGDGIPAADLLGVSTRADSRSVLRSKAQAIVRAKPGSWLTWEIYPASRASSARVCASSIRTGKQKTLASIAGPLETRFVTRDDGSIEVQVKKMGR